ncbi:MAG: hypothetical protein IIA45_07035 [Bacteroidetes bacterium]|nr:hypothetical protein [Bacteroidota bacterium]
MEKRDLLKAIIDNKRKEIAHLYSKIDLTTLKAKVNISPISFYDRIKATIAEGEPFFITEFKRRSPSKGWIKENANLADQVNKYVEMGANAISVLTDKKYFGGSYEDLAATGNLLRGKSMIILQKDFILDPIQIYLARLSGAHAILLIVNLLSVEELSVFRNIAESLGMGVLCEVHDLSEYHIVQDMKFPVIGINNRDLKTHKISLNRTNYIAINIRDEAILITESGIMNHRDLGIVKDHVQGFLIGTSLMQQKNSISLREQLHLAGGYFLKACGIRNAETLKNNPADWIGINFSKYSKRKVELAQLKEMDIPSNAVAIFRDNSPSEIISILSRFPFKAVQFYSDAITIEFIKKINQKVFLAFPLKSESDLLSVESFAPYVDLFILDGAEPGSGNHINIMVPEYFPYPFLLAGGIDSKNLDRVKSFKNCIGVDIATGVETDGETDIEKIFIIKDHLSKLIKTSSYVSSNA